jgi:IS5 family transposase
MRLKEGMRYSDLRGRDGDRINAVLAAAGYNFGLLLRWLARLLRALFQALPTAFSIDRLA